VSPTEQPSAPPLGRLVENLPSPPSPDPPRLAPGDEVGDLVVESLVGRGGMSEVYRVRHATRGTILALKMIDPRVVRTAGHRYQHMLCARLRREGRLQQAIRHPNVVRVEAILETGEGPALLMELVEGPSLHALLERRHVLTWRDVDDIAQGLMSGLARAQREGIVHRDVKPGNVLMARCDGRWVPKLTDFGLAKLSDDADDLTVTGQVMGTPGYMPARQMHDAKHVDATVDTYALGAVLYELATGRRLVPAWQRVNPELLGRALADLAASPVPPRMQRAIVAAVRSAGRRSDAAGVLAHWQGLEPVSREPRWRPWALLTVLGGFAAVWLALGILGLG